MSTHWITSWWNLIFVVPFGLALVYLGLYTLTGVDFGDADADADLDGDADFHPDVHDLDADADVDADIDADLHVDADGDVDHDVEHDVAAGGSPLGGALSAVGVGRVPLSIVLTLLLMSWGAAGFMTNVVAQPRLGNGPKVALLSVPLAALVSVLVARGVATLICRYMPLNETSARRRHELLGMTGRVVYPVGEAFGMAAVRDGDGNLFQVPCRVEPGRESIEEKAPVLLVGYRAKEHLFYVIPAPQAQAPAHGRVTKAS